jgi:hypothetical protein
MSTTELDALMGRVDDELKRAGADLVVAEGEARAIVIPLAALPAGSRVSITVDIGPPPPPPAPPAAPVAPELPQGPRVRPMMGTARR